MIPFGGSIEEHCRLREVFGVRRWVRGRRNRRAFRKAKQEAAQKGGVVCATTAHKGKPLYFVVSGDTSEEAIASKAFQLRHRRTPTPGEVTLAAIAQTWQKRHAREDVDGLSTGRGSSAGT